MTQKNNEKEAILPVAPKESNTSLNRIGLVVLVVIFSLALILTFKALLPKSQKSSDDVTAPIGKIIKPLTGSVINNNIMPISIEASDDRSGVKSVEIFYKTKGVWEKLTTINQPPFIYNWDVSGLPIQSVTLDIHVTDNAGNVLNTNIGGWQEDIIIIPILKGKVN